MSAGIPWVWPPATPVPVSRIPSYASDSLFGLPTGEVITVVPINNTFDLPGPAAGYVRVYDAVMPVPNTVVAPLGSRIDMVGTGIASPLRIWISLNTTTTQLARVPPIGVGQMLRFTNGAVNAVTLYATYNDIPASTITLVRSAPTNVLSTLIPAPPAGYVNRWLIMGEANPQLSPTARTPNPKVVIFNADTVSHTFETVQSGVIVGRSFATTTQTTQAPPGTYEYVVRAGQGPLQVRTLAAITTTPPNWVGAYETLRA